MGWSEGESLGKSQPGIKEPVSMISFIFLWKYIISDFFQGTSIKITLYDISGNNVPYQVISLDTNVPDYIEDIVTLQT